MAVVEKEQWKRGGAVVGKRGSEREGIEREFGEVERGAVGGEVNFCYFFSEVWGHLNTSSSAKHCGICNKQCGPYLNDLVGIKHWRCPKSWMLCFF